jgi:hypothetical protein
MIEAVYNHYFGSEDTNLYGAKRAEFEAGYRAANDAEAKIKALKDGMTLLLEQTVLEKPRIVNILKELALLRRPIGNRESLVD